MTDPAAAKPKPAGIIGTQIASLGAVSAFFFLLVKTYAVSGFSVTTTLGVISTAPVQVVLGAAAFYVYPLMPVLCVGLLLWFFVLLMDRRGTSLVRALVLGGAVLAALLSPQLYLPVVAGGVFALIGVDAVVTLVRCAIKSDAPPFQAALRQSITNLGSWLVAAAAVIALVISLQSMWLPAEVLTFENDAPTIGYVLDQSGDQVTFLRASDRALIRVPATKGTSHIKELEGLNDGTVPTSPLTGRQICHWRSPIPHDQGPILYALERKPYESPNLICTRILCYVHLLDPGLPLNAEPLIVQEIRALDSTQCAAYDETAE